MFEKFRLNRLARRLKKCKVTPLSRPQLRNVKVSAAGKTFKALDYINHVAAMLPLITVNGQAVDTRARMREIYYRNGLKGLNLYVSYIRLRLSIEMRNKKPAS